jgi:hypothetical protein
MTKKQYIWKTKENSTKVLLLWEDIDKKNEIVGFLPTKSPFFIIEDNKNNHPGSSFSYKIVWTNRYSSCLFSGWLDPIDILTHLITFEEFSSKNSIDYGTKESMKAIVEMYEDKSGVEIFCNGCSISRLSPLSFS